MKLLLLVAVSLVAAQDPWHATNPQPNPNPNPNPQTAWNPQPTGHHTPHATGHHPHASPAGVRSPHEVQPAPGPGPFVHKDYHPPPTAPKPRHPIGQVEGRLRRVEVMLGLIDPECRNPYNGPMRELRRLTYAADPTFVYHASEPEKQETARRSGYTQEKPIGRIATEPYDPNCECLIPLYRRNYDNHVYRIEYRTKDTYPCRKEFLTSRDYPTFDHQGDLKNWAIEGYCVPYRGACGANLQLSVLTPTKKIGDDRPLVLATEDADRVKWGYEKGWDETTLCYIWN